jgi:hypothetical protein
MVEVPGIKEQRKNPKRTALPVSSIDYLGYSSRGYSPVLFTARSLRDAIQQQEQVPLWQEILPLQPGYFHPLLLCGLKPVFQYSPITHFKN